MPDLIPFQYENHHIAVSIAEDGSPWWKLVDVCLAIGRSNPSSAVKALESDEYRDITFSDTTGRQQSILFVNESGLYRLLARSNKPEAKTFQRWVFHEVLPQIRKTGQYTPELRTRTASEMFLAQATINVELEQRQVAIEARQGEIEGKMQALLDRQPPAGKLRPGDWLRRFSKPHLSSQLMTLLNASCKRLETPEMWRPEGYDWPVPYYSPGTVALAYEEVTRQLSFLVGKRA